MASCIAWATVSGSRGGREEVLALEVGRGMRECSCEGELRSESEPALDFFEWSLLAILDGVLFSLKSSCASWVFLESWFWGLTVAFVARSGRWLLPLARVLKMFASFPSPAPRLIPSV